MKHSEVTQEYRDKISRRILLASTMGRPAYDVTISARPIELSQNESLRLEVAVVLSGLEIGVFLHYDKEAR